MLGLDWKQVQQQWVHTLGNLTLTGYNSELGDKSFEYKKTLPMKPGDSDGSQQPKGYKYSHLLLTQQIAGEQVWNESVMMHQSWIDCDDALALTRQCELVHASCAAVYARQKPKVEKETDTLLCLSVNR